MTQFSIKREELLKPLQMVNNVPEKRQTLPILSHLLLIVGREKAFIKATDLEIAIESDALLTQVDSEGALALPARKLTDICRNLPSEAIIQFVEEGRRCFVRSGSAQFSLATLPASDFPGFEEKNQTYVEIIVKQKDLCRLLQSTVFAIAQKDIRYFLNGMLLEITSDHLTFVAIDGHRMAFNRYAHSTRIQEKLAVIIPRKAVLELMRLLLSQPEELEVTLLVSAAHIIVKGSDFNFITRLVSGEFPNYEYIIPRHADKVFEVNRNFLKQALVRVSILSNEKLPAILMQMKDNNLFLVAKNAEKEEAREEIAIAYPYPEMSIGFNVTYLLDSLNVLRQDIVKITLLNSVTAFIVQDSSEELGWSSLFVIMPMNL